MLLLVFTVRSDLLSREQAVTGEPSVNVFVVKLNSGKELVGPIRRVKFGIWVGGSGAVRFASGRV